MDTPEIIWVGADPSNFEHGGEGRQVLVLVNHIMLGSLAGTDDWFGRKHPNPSSAHYGLGADGTIHQYVQDWDVAYSNGNVLHPNLAAVPWLANFGAGKQNPNQITISVEWAGDHTWVNNQVGGHVQSWWKPNEVQYQAGLRLVRYLVAKHGIKADRSHITRHSDFDSINKSFCPGLGFNLARLITDLQGVRETLYVDYEVARTLPISVKAAPKIAANVFAAVLSPNEKHSPAYVYSQALYDECVAHYVDPAVALAFFGRESTFGTDPNGLYAKTLNWGNIVAGSSWHGPTYPFAGHQFRVYPDPVAGLRDWCELWNSPVYAGKSLREQIAIYAPGSDGNAPDRYADYVTTCVRAWLDRSRSFVYLGAA